MFNRKPAAVISPPETIAQAAISQTNATTVRPEKSDSARGDIEQPFKYQQSPAVLLAADRPHRRNDSEDAVDQHIGGEQQYQRQYRWTGKDQREDSKDDA